MSRLQMVRNITKSSKWRGTVLVLLLLFGWHRWAIAAQVTVGFEGLSGVSFSSLEPVAESAKLSNQLAATFGVMFSSEATKPYVAVVTLPSSFTNPPSGTRAIVAVDQNDILSYHTPVIVEFVRPSDPSIAGTADFVSIRTVLVAGGGKKMIEAFDARDVLIGSVSHDEFDPTPLSLRRPSIHSVRLSQTQGHLAFDDLIFNVPLGDPLRISIEADSRQVRWNSESNREYQVQDSSTLTSNSWENLGGLVDGDGSMMSVTVRALDEPQRFYRVQLVLPLFEYAIAANGTIDLGGNNLRIDSFDSSVGSYGETNISDFGNVATNDGITNSINVGNAEIWGKVSTGPHGTVYLGPQGSIGDMAWHLAGRKGFEPGYVSDDFSVDFPPISAPSIAESYALETSGDPIVMNASSGYYLNGDLSLQNQTLLVTNASTFLYTTGGLSVGGTNGQIVIAAGASLKLYARGMVNIGGRGVTNSGGASALILYGLPTCTSVAFDLGPAFTGAIYAPNADLTLRGSFINNQANADDFYGAVVARSVRLSGHFSFHYDKNLRSVGPTR